MMWFNVLVARVRALLRRNAVLDDIDEELRSHVEMETEVNVERGMAPDEARRAALRSFGNVAVLLKPLPFAESDRLMMVWLKGQKAAGGDRVPLSVADLLD